MCSEKVKCKGCKLIKIVLKLKKFPSNLENIGWIIKELINDNKDKIFDDLIQRFGAGASLHRKSRACQDLILPNFKI